jgi:hypothetical protein
VTIQDPGSVMRPTLGDGKARLKNFTFRFDPLNALVMNIWAEEFRRGPLTSADEASAITRLRLARVYKALVKASPGNSLALGYLNDFDKAAAADPGGKKDRPVIEPKQPVDPGVGSDAAHPRQVLRAVVTRARANTGAARLSGDDLTAAYVRAAADEAMKVPEKDRAAAFLLGVAVALDDTAALLADPKCVETVKAIESDAERAERVAVLGNPTLRGRRDLRRRFALGCGTCEARAFTESEAIDAAVGRFLADLDTQSGAGFPSLSADLAGAAFARSVRSDPGMIQRVRDKFTADDFLPVTAGLRDGLTTERFKEDFGTAADPRFREVVTTIRDRVKKLPVYGK